LQLANYDTIVTICYDIIYIMFEESASLWHGLCFLNGHMKINLIPTRKLALLCTIAAGALLAFSHSARALTIGDSHELGFVNFGIPSGDSDRLNYVNHLIGMALGSTDQAFGQTFFRSNNAFGSLPQAVLAGHVNGTSTSINLGAGGLYTYLFAKYDGPNYGSEVWYVGDLSGIITIPATAGGYGLSGWTLFGPGVPGVPDGGTTAMLLGAALSALGIARRALKI
jgi:VPDSG-CTERM motif